LWPIALAGGEPRHLEIALLRSFLLNRRQLATFRQLHSRYRAGVARRGLPESLRDKVARWAAMNWRG